jgi:hypothetical protein
VASVGTEGFAARLEALKDASGLSYGVLARKLHVSPSTLHRYVNGESLPARFELVEQYARLCGAGPEEHLELHRCWLLADAARRARAQNDHPAPDHPATDHPATDHPAIDHPAPTAPARSTGRWRGLVAVAALVLLVAVTATATGAWRSRGGTTATVAAPVTEVPISVQARTEPLLWGGRCSPPYLIDRPPSQVPLPPSSDRRNAWIRALDGIPVGQQLLKVTVTTDAPGVVLDSLEAELKAHGPVVYRNAFVSEPGCGPAPALPAFFVDLDGSLPRLVPASGQPDFPLLVSGGTPTVFYVRASAEWHRADWVLHLRWSSGARRGALTVDDGGTPFRISGPAEVGLFQAVTGRGWTQRVSD